MNRFIELQHDPGTQIPSLMHTDSSHLIHLLLSVLVLSWLTASLAAAPDGSPDAQDVKPPNVIVFLVDDMGVMDTSVPMLPGPDGEPKTYPLNERYRTPGMQRLAKQGIRFSDFYAQSVCSPTRISIMTGQNAARHGTTNWINPDHNNRGTYGPPDWNWQGLGKRDVTLPGLLSKAGYRTIHVGKAHFGPQAYVGSEPTNLGFDVNIGGDSWGRPRSYYGTDYYGNHPKKYDHFHHNVPDLVEYHGTDTYLTEALTREANERVAEAVKQNRPFYLYMAHYAVHSPFMTDPRFDDHYSDLNGNARSYATMIEGIDRSLRDVIDRLHKLGVAKNTIIFFLGDNGTDAPIGGAHSIACAAPLRGKKATHYEGGTSVPFIAAWADPDADHHHQKNWPILRGALQTRQFGTVMDLFPTILELTGLDAPDGHTVDGQSLKPLLTGKDPSTDERRSFLMHYPHNHRSSYFTSLRLGDWKLIYHYFPGMSPANKRYELFNLAQDRSESNNLAEKKPDQLRRMVRAMKDELKAQNGHYPVSRNGRTALKPRLPDYFENRSLFQKMPHTGFAQYTWDDGDLLDNELPGFELNSVVNGSNDLNITDEGALFLPGHDGASERDYLEVDGPGGASSWTVSFWFRTPRVDQGENQGLFSNNRGPEQNWSWEVNVHNGTLRLRSKNEGAPNPILSNSGSQSPSIKPDTWHHVVVRKTGSDGPAELYLGTSESISKVGQIKANPGGLQMFRIGVNRDSSGLYRAEISNVSIFGTTVSPEKLNKSGPFHQNDNE